MSEQDIFSQGYQSAASPNLGDADSGRRTRIQRAALWAAYGDALGWISELTDSSGLSRRTRGRSLTEPMAWTRRIGGRSGVTTELPQGCYSDDTQLRLATSRAIRRDGFDVEAFAKVELPVWLSYGLGGGKSTSAAAQHLAQSGSTWWRNRFKGWTGSGGNGAAMRIQPHVWAGRNSEQPESYLLDVVRNAICTHSHPTGLMGAVLHAQCVAYSLDTGAVPPPGKLESMLAVANDLPDMIDGDRDLSLWRVAFEEEADPFRDAWATALHQARRAITTAGGCADATGEERYRTIVDGLGLRDATRRGSGMLTSVAATALAWCEPRAGEAMRIAANTLGTDTDTIATMAGAILGATVDEDPLADVLDADLIRCDAERLADIGCGRDPTNHRYPDLMHWVAPKTRADALARSRDGRPVVRGLGSATQLEDRDELASKGFRWRWLRLDFGQTLLIKSRENVPYEDETPRRTLPRRGISSSPGNAPPPGKPADVHRPDRAAGPSALPTEQEPPPPADAHDIRAVVGYAREHIHDDQAVGRVLRRVVRKGSTGEIAGFVAALVDLLNEDSAGRTS